MFGREASKLLDYVEYFPDGYKTGTKMVKACADANLEGFPTWVIKGQVRKPFPFVKSSSLDFIFSKYGYLFIPRKFKWFPSLYCF